MHRTDQHPNLPYDKQQCIVEDRGVHATIDDSHARTCETNKFSKSHDMVNKVKMPPKCEQRLIIDRKL